MGEEQAPNFAEKLELDEAYKRLLDNGNIVYIPIDGLDGSGKATLASDTSDMLINLGYDVLTVGYPVYTLPWGSFIRNVLRDEHANIEVVDKMYAYALNRVETLYSIKQACVEQFSIQQRPQVVIFDRFYTSNVVTIAYYLFRRGIDIAQHVSDEVYNLLNTLQQIDSEFISHLEAGCTPVYIPRLSVEEVTNAIKSDATRDRNDVHENAAVQNIARALYDRLAIILPFINFIEAEDADGIRVNRDIMVTKLLGYFPNLQQIGGKGQRVELGADPFPGCTYSILESVLKRTKNLANLDPNI